MQSADTLLRDLEPDDERLLQRHLDTTKEWFPHRLVPWSRKAHELVLHAAEVDRQDEVRRGLFELAFREGRDLGRVDVLVSFAGGLGLDLTHAKAVLDVDRHAGRVAEGRSLAAEWGVDAPPALVVGSRVLRGFHNRDALGTFLG